MELYTFLGLIHSDSLQLTRNYAVCGVSAIKCPFHNTKSAARACKVPKKKERNQIPFLVPPNYTNFLLYIIWLIAPLTWKRSKLIVTLNNGIRGQWSREQIYVPIYVWSIIFIKNMGQAGRWAGSEKMKKIKTGRVGAAFRSFRWGGVCR